MVKEIIEIRNEIAAIVKELKNTDYYVGKKQKNQIVEKLDIVREKLTQIIMETI